MQYVHRPILVKNAKMGSTEKHVFHAPSIVRDVCQIVVALFVTMVILGQCVLNNVRLVVYITFVTRDQEHVRLDVVEITMGLNVQSV